MDPIEEVIAALWKWAVYAEDDPGDFRALSPQEVQALQLDLLRAIEILKLDCEPTVES